MNKEGISYLYMSSKVTDSNTRKLRQHVAVYKNLVYKYEAF